MKRAGLIIAVLAIIYFIFLIRQDIINYRDLVRDQEAVGRRVAFEENRSLELRERLARLKGNDLVEEIARTKLGLIKKGETAYKVVLEK
ncbi:MAG: septum formation initiator family protein [Candidatus Margulisiibacteriota bacterium]|jgi:cell division protein FtsB